VQACGAVEPLVEDDADLLEVLLLRRLEVLTHAAVGAAGLAHVDVAAVLDEVDDGPVREPGESAARLLDGLRREAELLDLKGGHISCSVPWPSRRGTSRECARASPGRSPQGRDRVCRRGAGHR